MSIVRLRGGPFDGRACEVARKSSLHLESGTDFDHVCLAGYERKGDDLVFDGYRRVCELAGGPLDGQYLQADLDKPHGFPIYSPVEGGLFAKYVPVGSGRYAFDGRVTADAIKNETESNTKADPGLAVGHIAS